MSFLKNRPKIHRTRESVDLDSIVFEKQNIALKIAFFLFSVTIL